MKYLMLLWPHANARYRAEAARLSEAELQLLLAPFAPGAAVSQTECLGVQALSVECADALGDRALNAVSRHSLMYGLFEQDGAALKPVAGRAQACLGEDLPAILKYKGKTNEMFLQMLINVAYASGDFYGKEQPVTMLDPMCGRATSLFVAANYGWDAVGTDVDKADLHEAEMYFKRYLEYNRLKHAIAHSSLTLPKKGAVSVCAFTYADDNEQYKQKQTRTLRLAQTDAANARVFGKNAFEVIACDLPYGVQHTPQDAGRGGIEPLLRRVLPAWRDSLKNGGAMALSYNAQTLKGETIRRLMAEAGLQVCEGGAYEGMKHWVEQAVTRDIAVAKKA